MKAYLSGGPIDDEERWLDNCGIECQVFIFDNLGLSPLKHTWVPSHIRVNDVRQGQYIIYNYAGRVYSDQAVGPRAKDKAKADIRLKWWEIEDHMKELGLTLDLNMVVSNSYVEASIDLCHGSDHITLDSREEDID